MNHQQQQQQQSIDIDIDIVIRQVLNNVFLKTEIFKRVRNDRVVLGAVVPCVERRISVTSDGEISTKLYIPMRYAHIIREDKFRYEWLIDNGHFSLLMEILNNKSHQPQMKRDVFRRLMETSRYMDNPKVVSQMLTYFSEEYKQLLTVEAPSLEMVALHHLHTATRFDNVQVWQLFINFINHNCLSDYYQSTIILSPFNLYKDLLNYFKSFYNYNNDNNNNNNNNNYSTIFKILLNQLNEDKVPYLVQFLWNLVYTRQAHLVTRLILDEIGEEFSRFLETNYLVPTEPTPPVWRSIFRPKDSNTRKEYTIAHFYRLLSLAAFDIAFGDRAHAILLSNNPDLVRAEIEAFKTHNRLKNMFADVLNTKLNDIFSSLTINSGPNSINRLYQCSIIIWENNNNNNNNIIEIINNRVQPLFPTLSTTITTTTKTNDYCMIWLFALARHLKPYQIAHIEPVIKTLESIRKTNTDGTAGRASIEFLAHNFTFNLICQHGSFEQIQDSFYYFDKFPNLLDDNTYYMVVELLDKDIPLTIQDYSCWEVIGRYGSVELVDFIYNKIIPNPKFNNNNNNGDNYNNDDNGCPWISSIVSELLKDGDGDVGKEIV
ncbi:hypothetical protein DFA_06167 [Cavenderia fasciculata]|uniref:Uncharacterized protein n=1 Tax=Cavenderia fasciculata TaxID=261658 RepID=F4PKA5_CACFS|nr:uncharacterized protein DFA_06167 [Cavenderia fasciculata]EGG24029.1 hypothetical protein DFA_06167 [Cavenderia fasciculata]|eukprot:XP_004361880.1 hypothetical protein DFA_06167 [Cavenderia fasciculata]